MKLTCPLCGNETEVREDGAFRCLACGGWVRREQNGRAWLLRACAGPAEGEEAVRPLLTQAARTEDPVKKKALLVQAEKLCPDSLAVQTELLHLGRLDQRSPRRLDYHVIKCYLLHVFEDPRDETPEIRRAMVRELTEDPRLLRCLDLAPDRDAYLRGYLTRLSREYIQLFLEGSSQHMQKFFGFQVVRPEKALARPVAAMLDAMEDAALPAPFGALLPACFLETFRQEVGSDAYVQAARKEREG